MQVRVCTSVRACVLEEAAVSRKTNVESPLYKVSKLSDLVCKNCCIKTTAKSYTFFMEHNDYALTETFLALLPN